MLQKLLTNALAFLLSWLIKWLASQFDKRATQKPREATKTVKVAPTPQKDKKIDSGASVVAQEKLVVVKPVKPMPSLGQIAERDERLKNLRDRLKAEIEQAKQLGKYEIMNDESIWKKGKRGSKDGITETSNQGSTEEAGT